jgi:hypothetical protein
LTPVFGHVFLSEKGLKDAGTGSGYGPVSPKSTPRGLGGGGGGGGGGGFQQTEYQSLLREEDKEEKEEEEEGSWGVLGVGSYCELERALATTRLTTRLGNHKVRPAKVHD